MKMKCAISVVAILATSVQGLTLRGELVNTLEAESAQQVGSDSQSNAEDFAERFRSLLSAAIGELPGGEFGQLLLETIWPSEEVDLWDLVKERFNYLLTESIASTIITDVKGYAGGIAEQVGDFQNQAVLTIANPGTYSVHEKLDDAIDAIVMLRNKLSEYNIATDESSFKALAQLIPLAVGCAVSEMTLRRYQYNVCHDTSFTQTSGGKTTNMYEFNALYCSSTTQMVRDMESVWTEWRDLLKAMYPKWYSWRLSKFSWSYQCWSLSWGVLNGISRQETSCNFNLFGEKKYITKTGSVVDSLLGEEYDIEFFGDTALGGLEMSGASFENCLLAIRERWMTAYALEMQTLMAPAWILRRTIPGSRSAMPEVPEEMRYVVVGPISGLTVRSSEASTFVVTEETNRFPTAIARVNGAYGDMTKVRVYYNDARTVLGYKFTYSTANLMSYGPGHWRGQTLYIDTTCGSSQYHISGMQLGFFSASNTQTQPYGFRIICTSKSDGTKYFNNPKNSVPDYSIRLSGGMFYRLQGAMVLNPTEDYTQALIFEYVDPEGYTAARNMDGLSAWSKLQSTSYVDSTMRTYFINAAKLL